VSDDDNQVDPFYKTDYKVKQKSFLLEHLNFEKERLKGFKVKVIHKFINYS
jgi:hypothetical protein